MNQQIADALEVLANANAISTHEMIRIAYMAGIQAGVAKEKKEASQRIGQNQIATLIGAGGVGGRGVI